ncbi:MAG: hypothetical protein QM796_03335 [Chthoniobacteraceae bacterium]
MKYRLPFFLFLLALPLSPAFGQLRMAPPAQGDQTPPPFIGPVAVPMPVWEITAIVGGIIAAVGIIAWIMISAHRNRPQPIPPTPKEIALAELEKIHPQISTMEPYAFSIAVCDILRAYVLQQYQLGAPRQTSPEFLASIGDSPKFSGEEKTLLGQFLEKCDLIKFAHIQASSEDSTALWQQARRFVEGGVA